MRTIQYAGEMSWTWAEGLPLTEAYALALLVRLYSCRQKTKRRKGGSQYLFIGERYLHAPTILTEEHVRVIGSTWSYLRSVIRKNGFTTTDEVDAFVAGDDYGPEAWAGKHPAHTTAGEVILMKLTGRFVCYG